MIKRGAMGKLRLATHPYDEDPDGPQTGFTRPRQFSKPLPATNLIRAAHLAAQDNLDGLGYRGLERFLRLAKDKGVKVIVAPIPEPEFARYGAWMQGVNVDIVDARIAELSAAHGAVFLPRVLSRHIEHNDLLFSDVVHMNSSGRAAYSLWLAERIASLLE